MDSYLHELVIPADKLFFPLHEVIVLTAEAVYPRRTGELSVEDALKVLNQTTDLHFMKQPVTPNNIILKRMSVESLHKAFLELQIRNKTVVPIGLAGSVPLRCPVEDIPKQKVLFEDYALPLPEMEKFVNSLYINLIRKGTTQ